MRRVSFLAHRGLLLWWGRLRLRASKRRWRRRRHGLMLSTIGGGSAETVSEEASVVRVLVPVAAGRLPSLWRSGSTGGVSPMAEAQVPGSVEELRSRGARRSERTPSEEPIRDASTISVVTTSSVSAEEVQFSFAAGRSTRRRRRHGEPRRRRPEQLDVEGSRRKLRPGCAPSWRGT